MIIGVLGLAGGAAQFVFSAVDLTRRGELLRSNGADSSGRVDRRELSRERAAFQGTLLASAMLMVAALAYLLAHQRYLPYEAGQSAYHRQRAVAQVGVALAGVAVLSAGFGWLRWSQTRTWRRELLLAVMLLVLAGALIFAFFDLPALTESAPSGEPPARGLLGTP
jgi:zinc transporter ZupT